MYGLGADISLPPCRIGGNLSHSMSDLHAALAPRLEELLTDSCFFFLLLFVSRVLCISSAHAQAIQLRSCLKRVGDRKGRIVFHASSFGIPGGRKPLLLSVCE